MRTITRSLATLAVTATLATYSNVPADADSWTTEYPSTDFVLPADSDGISHITLVGPKNVWGMRLRARQLDAALPKVTVEFADTCTTDPDDTDYEPTCVFVEVGNFGSTGWAGLTHLESTSDGEYAHNTRTIQLNRTMTTQHTRPVKYRRHVAAHEFVHVLGMLHHTQPVGLLSTDMSNATSRPPVPTADELASLQSVYGD